MNRKNESKNRKRGASGIPVVKGVRLVQGRWVELRKGVSEMFAGQTITAEFNSNKEAELAENSLKRFVSDRLETRGWFIDIHKPKNRPILRIRRYK